MQTRIDTVTCQAQNIRRSRMSARTLEDQCLAWSEGKLDEKCSQRTRPRISEGHLQTLSHHGSTPETDETGKYDSVHGATRMPYLAFTHLMRPFLGKPKERKSALRQNQETRSKLERQPVDCGGITYCHSCGTKGQDPQPNEDS